MKTDVPALGAIGLRRFQELGPAAASTVAERFCASNGTVYAQFGDRGRDACREDLTFHLEFLRPVLEFGLVEPMVDYLRWLAGVLAARNIPAAHLPQSLDWLAEFYAARMEGPDAQIVVDALHRARARFVEPGRAASPIQGSVPELWPECELFESALLAGDRRGAGALLDRCLDDGRGLVSAELHVIQPALYEIGKKWQENQATVAQEHLASAIAQSTMTLGLMKSELPESNGRRILLACVAGNRHSLGLQMVADAFQLAGWEVQYLGADVPTSSVVQQIDQFKPEMLGLSVSFAQQLRAVKELMLRLTLHESVRPAVIVGGLAVNQFNPVASLVGADAWSPNAPAAVLAASSLSRAWIVL